MTRRLVVLAMLAAGGALAQEEPAPGATPAATATPAPVETAPPVATPPVAIPTAGELIERTRVGGYAEAQSVWTRTGYGERFFGEADLSRAVLALDTTVAPGIDAGFEFEWEHAIACGGGCGGIAEVEQAWVDVRVNRAIVVRSGLFLVPMGLVALRHEPIAYHGVTRPAVERVIIPSTWREMGVAVHGDVGDASEYHLAMVTAMDPTGIAPGGLAGTRQHGNFSRADAPAFVARFESEPLLGFAWGLSGYASDAGPNIDVATESGERYQFEYPVFGVEADVRVRIGPFRVRALATAFELPESEALAEASRPDGSPYFDPSIGPIASRMGGAYLELGYDLARHAMPFELFARGERVDPQWEVPDGTHRRQDLRTTEGTFGLSYRPAPPVVFKADVQLVDRVRGLDETRLNLGMGLLY